MTPACYKKVLIVLFFLLLSSEKCTAAGNTIGSGEGVYGYVKDENGSPIVNAGVSLFDGSTLSNNIKTDSNGRYKIFSLSVSMNRYAVIFFTKEGYIPQAANIKMYDRMGTEYSAVMKMAETGNTGFVIGTIYQPIRGGKLKFQSGIYSFGKKSGVLLEQDGKIIKKETDKEGHFLFVVPSGRYKLSRENDRKSIEVDVSAGQTVIKNLRSGIILVD